MKRLTNIEHNGKQANPPIWPRWLVWALLLLTPWGMLLEDVYYDYGVPSGVITVIGAVVLCMVPFIVLHDMRAYVGDAAPMAALWWLCSVVQCIFAIIWFAISWTDIMGWDVVVVSWLVLILRYTVMLVMILITAVRMIRHKMR